MRILLAQPAPFEHGRLGLENVIWMSEPVALTAVAAAVDPGHEVRILDMRLEPATAFAETLNQFRPDVVGVTSMTTDCYQAKALLYAAKRWSPEVVTVIGGHHPTQSTAEFHEPYVDVIVRGEGEYTFRELIRTVERGSRDFSGVDGIVWRAPAGEGGAWRANRGRAQSEELDALPAPAFHLLAKYRKQYFFMITQPMGSIFTSRGCSFDCNFCAIWEFYERRTRYLSARKIAEQMAARPEPFIFVLDDNFLTQRRRLEELCDELEARKVKKIWMTQGRADFVAEHPELIARLARNGLTGLLSGFETNDDQALQELRKKSSFEKNLRAAEVLRANGIVSTGIFMARADFEERDFEALYRGINQLGIALPIVTILTPLPGTELYKRRKRELVTDDLRLYDLLHAVLPTKLPRERFYELFAQNGNATVPSLVKGLVPSFFRKSELWTSTVRNYPRFAWRWWRYRRVHYDPQSFLRDEQGQMRRFGGAAEAAPAEQAPARRRLEVLP